MSIFLEEAEDYEYEQDTHFHEPDFEMTGNDGEYEHDDDGIPSFVDADEPSSKAQKFAMGEFTSIFVNEDLSDVKTDNSDMNNRNGNTNNRWSATKTIGGQKHEISRTQGLNLSTYGSRMHGKSKKEHENIRKRDMYEYHGGKEAAKKKIARMRLKQDAQKFKEQGNIYEATALELEAMEML